MRSWSRLAPLKLAAGSPTSAAEANVPNSVQVRVEIKFKSDIFQTTSMNNEQQSMFNSGHFALHSYSKWVPTEKLKYSMSKREKEEQLIFIKEILPRTHSMLEMIHTDLQKPIGAMHVLATYIYMLYSALNSNPISGMTDFFWFDFNYRLRANTRNGWNYILL